MRITEITPEFIKAITESIKPETLVDLFNTHPDVGLFYITSDGQAFFAENMADSHSQKLKVRAVLELHRDEVEDFDEETFDTPYVDQEAIDKAAAEKEAADKAAAEKEAADKAAVEKEAADKAAADKAAADKASADKEAADKATADKATADKAAADKAAADKAAADKAALANKTTEGGNQ